MGFTGLLRQLSVFIWPFWYYSLIVILAILVDVGLETAVRLSFITLIDDALIPKNQKLLFMILAGYGVVVVLKLGVTMTQDYFWSKAASRVLNEIYMKIFTHVQKLSISFFARKKAGDVTARFSTDLASVENFLIHSQALPIVIYSILGIIMNLIPLFWLEWRLATLAVLSLPLTVLGSRLLQRKAVDAGYKQKEEQGQMVSFVQENVQAQSVVKAFSLQPVMIEHFQQRLENLFRISFRANLLSYFMERVSYLGLFTIDIIFIGASAWMIFHDYISIGDFISLHGLFLGASQSLLYLLQQIPSFLQGTAGMQRIDELLKENIESVDVENPSPPPRFSDELRFENVSFHYKPEERQKQRASLRSVNFKLKKGESLTIVGKSGSGKSTIVNLLLRFYNPSEGHIYFDGTDIRKYDSEKLREQIAIVFQENFLFNTSIRQNISFGKPNADLEEIIRSAKKADIHQFIESLPQGYDTVIGERGGGLSGGQKQRIAIARALVRKPEILILDEATSALDPTTESLINETLDEIAQDCTVIRVTHKLTSIHPDDHILVMADGEIVEHGKKEELIALNGYYYRMWMNQTDKKESTFRKAKK